MEKKRGFGDAQCVSRALEGRATSSEQIGYQRTVQGTHSTRRDLWPLGQEEMREEINSYRVWPID